MTPQDWQTRLGPSELPAFQHTLAALSKLRREGDGLPASRAAAVILTDPLLTLRVLHAANNRSRLEPNVCTVEHALMMSGLQSFLESLPAIAAVENTALGRNASAMGAIHALLRRAQHAAWQARDFAVLHRDIRAEEVQVAALLHFAPLFLMWLKTPDEARHLQRLARRVGAEHSEQEVLGQPMQALRMQLLEIWRMPDLIRDLLDERNAERNRQALLRACLDIAVHCERGWWATELTDDYARLAGVENMPLEEVIATVHANAARVARHDDWITAPPAAAWLVMEPGEWPADEDEDEDAEPRVAAAAAQRAEPASPARAASGKPQPAAETPPAVAEEAPHVCPMPNKQAFQDSLRSIESHLDRSLNLNQMSAIILKGLHTGLGLSRIMFAMATPDGKRVKSRFTLGIPTDDPLRHFEFELEGKDLFAQLMKKMQGVWLNEDNRERLWPMVGPRLREMIGVGDFYAMSLLSGSRPVGMIYGDRGHGECGLDPHTYTDFKMLCLQAARGLSQLKT